MIRTFITLVSYTNGIIMIAVFGLVCIALVAAVLIAMFSEKKVELYQL